MTDMSIEDYLAHGGKLTSPGNVPARYRGELLRLMASFVDSELAASAGFANAINDAPGIKSRIAAARITLEKADHAERVLAIMADFGVDTDRYEGVHPWAARLPRDADIGATRQGGDMRLSVFHYPMTGWVDAPHIRDALKSCDVIFGCTDDHAGRLYLNRVAHFYLIPVIDVGLVLMPRDDGEPGLLEMAARVSMLFPTSACHGCRGTVDRVRAREEDLQRSDPAEYERQKTEAYVRSGGNPAPAVVTFTSEAATMAVNELLAGLVDFRGGGGWTWQRYRKLDKGFARSQAAQPRSDCPVCGSEEYWGLGDIDPFLDRIG